MTGVQASNFTPVPGGGVVVSGSPSVTAVNSSTYTVTVNTTAASGSGTLGLNLSSAGTIKDSSNDALQGTPYTGPVYTVDKTAPTATVTFPANGGLYNSTAYGAGCSPLGICGTAADATGVASVRVSVKQGSSGSMGTARPSVA